MNKKIYINGRFLTQELTGVQRFAYEISKNLSSFNKKNLVLLIPTIDTKSLSYSYNFQIKKIGKNKGHLWEQIDLLLFLKNNKNPLLLNLTNSGPLLYKNQISTIHDIIFVCEMATYCWKLYMYIQLTMVITYNNRPLMIYL